MKLLTSPKLLFIKNFLYNIYTLNLWSLIHFYIIIFTSFPISSILFHNFLFISIISSCFCVYDHFNYLKLKKRITEITNTDHPLNILFANYLSLKYSNFKFIVNPLKDYIQKHKQHININSLQDFEQYFIDNNINVYSFLKDIENLQIIDLNYFVDDIQQHSYFKILPENKFSLDNSIQTSSSYKTSNISTFNELDDNSFISTQINQLISVFNQIYQHQPKLSTYDQQQIIQTHSVIHKIIQVYQQTYSFSNHEINSQLIILIDKTKESLNEINQSIQHNFIKEIKTLTQTLSASK